MDKNKNMKILLLIEVVAILIVCAAIIWVLKGKKAEEDTSNLMARMAEEAEDDKSRKTDGNEIHRENGAVREDEKPGVSDEGGRDEEPGTEAPAPIDKDFEWIRDIFILEPDTGLPKGIPEWAVYDIDLKNFYGGGRSFLEDECLIPYLDIDYGELEAWFDVLDHVNPLVVADFMEENFLNNPDFRALLKEAYAEHIRPNDDLDEKVDLTLRTLEESIRGWRGSEDEKFIRNYEHHMAE